VTTGERMGGGMLLFIKDRIILLDWDGGSGN